MKIKNCKFILPLLLCFATTVIKSQSKWQELRSFGVNSYTTNTIYSLAEDFAYQIVYASIGNEVYRWKGGNTSWEQLGKGASTLHADGIIYSVATDKSHNVYAAGWFSNANGKYYVAKATWNNTTFENDSWSELGGANGLNASGPIYSVITDNAGNIYAAGSFISATGYRYVAKWNGANWSELGTGNNALKANSYIYALCTDDAGNIYAAGDFTNSSGKKYVAKWNGSSWAELGVSTNALNANAVIKSLTTDKNGNIFAAGQFTNSSGKPYAAKWNGSNWAELGTGTAALNPNNFIYTITADQSGNIYAAGDFSNSSGKKYVAKWNGSSWAELGTTTRLDANNTIHSIITDSKNSVFTAGNFTNYNGFKYVADYRSISDSWAETAATGTGSIDGISVNTITTNYNSDTVYAAGCLLNGNFRRYVVKWDGKSWKELGALNADYCIAALVADSLGNVYAGGRLTVFLSRM